MRKKIEINQLQRKDLFLRYRDYDEPYFSITADVVCTNAYRFAKKNNYSFFLYYLFMTLEAVNRIPSFKFRIEGDDLFLYDTINAFTTIDHDNRNFGYALIPYFENLDLFMEKAQSAIVDMRLSGHPLSKEHALNNIHFSTVPWIKFSGISLPRQFKNRESVPKIVFGKMFDEHGEKKIPVSVHVHHGLVDGLHVSEFLNMLETLMAGDPVR